MIDPNWAEGIREQAKKLEELRKKESKELRVLVLTAATAIRHVKIDKSILKEDVKILLSVVEEVLNETN